MYKNKRSRRIVVLAWLTVLLVAFTGILEVSAQPTPALTEDWRNTDYGFISSMMDTDLSDNIYVVGFTTVGDYLIIKKFSPAGDLLWQTTYNPTERLRGVWIAVDSNGSPVVLATIVAGSNADPAGWYLLKYDTDGNLSWANSLPGAYRDARRVEVDANDDIYVAGRTFTSSLDSALIKFNPDGDALWTEIFDNNNAVDEPFSLAISPDSTLIGVAGKSGNLFMALMYDPAGNLLWSDTSSEIYPANDVAFGPGNVSYFATGTYFPQDPNTYQMAIAAYDTSGSQLWLNSYSQGDRTYRVAVDELGDILATGIDQAGYLDWMTIKTDADGNLLWSQRYDGGKNNDETPNMLVLDASGAVYVTGKGGPNPSSGNISYIKGVVAKYNADGTPQWAVFDDYAGGKALGLGAGDALTSLGFGYLVTTHYTQTGLPDVVPAAPTDLIASVGLLNPTSVVSLSFTDNANNEFWVEIERCQGSGCTDFSKIGQTRGENATAYTDEDVVDGATYTYRVLARGFMGPSDYSNTVEVTIAPVDPPAAPSSLTAEMSNGGVLLSWQDNSTNESQFHIERCQGAGCANFIFVGSTGANVTTWTDYGVIAGESYSYRVRAWNQGGYSDYSNIATILVPGNPNSAPILDFIGDRSVDELTTLTFTATASDVDEPPQALTFSLGAGAPSGASIDSQSGVFSWTPGEEQGPGVYPLTVIVTDDGIPPLSDEETLTVTVNEVNLAPMVSAGPDQTVQESQPVQFSGVFTDTGLLERSLADAQIQWDFGDGLLATGTLTPTHTYADNGVFTVTLVVTDSLGAVGRDSLQITATNVAPALAALPDQVLRTNQLLVLPVAFTDPGGLDSHVVMVEWMPGVSETLDLPAGVAAAVFQHVYAQAGQFTASVTVTDKDGAFDHRTFTVSVEAYRVFLPDIQQ